MNEVKKGTKKWFKEIVFSNVCPQLFRYDLMFWSSFYI